jgi:hypothetical protein
VGTSSKKPEGSRESLWRRWVINPEIDRELNQYPQLEGMDREVARKWLKSCRREALRGLSRWGQTLRFGNIAIAIAYSLLALAVFGGLLGTAHIRFPVQIVLFGVGFTWFFYFRRALDRAVQRRTNAELMRGRFLSCIACDYDLRGTPGDTCPECGASVLVPRVKAKPEYRYDLV